VAYCTVVDVRLALAQAAATSGTNSAADMDDATIQDSIEEASAQADLFLGGPYSTSDFVPGVLLYWCRDVAAFLAASVWRQSKDWTTLDPVYLRWQGAVAGLQAVANGTLSMPMPGNAGDTTGGGATVINMIDIDLFQSWNFDLWGKSVQPGAGRRFGHGRYTTPGEVVTVVSNWWDTDRAVGFW
jgi:phage gp36-like protein